MANIYERRRLWKIAFLAVSLVLVAVFLQVSNNLVKDLSQQERDRMEIWAKATKELATAPVYDPMPLDSLGTNYMAMPSSDIDFFSALSRTTAIFPYCWWTITTIFCNTEISVCRNLSTV